MKILIVSEFFPPLNNIASGRPYSWASYLSSAHKVTVITTNKTKYDAPLDYVKDCSHFEFIEIDNAVNTFAGRLKWVIGSLKKLKAADYDVVISTSNPWLSHLVPFCLKLINKKIKWIADFRDLWSINHYGYIKKNSFRNRVHTFIEKAIISKCNAITTVSEPLAHDMKQLHTEKEIKVIYNGFEELSAVSESKNSDKVTIVYTGTIYKGRRDPSVLFHAVSQLISEKAIEKDKIEILFFGAKHGDLENIIDKNDISRDIVKVLPMISRHECISIQNKASALLLLEWGDTENKGILTGKLFEYLAAGTPIISIGPDETFESSKLIIKTNTGFVCANDTEKAKNAILQIYKNNYSYSPDYEVIGEFSRKEQAKSLERLVEQL